MTRLYVQGTPQERLDARIIACPDSNCECLIWTGAHDKCGYGQAFVDGRVQYIHRVAWQLANGPIPDGLMIDHVAARGCRHRDCAYVGHLEPVTLAENLRRAGRWMADKTHCPSGHPYDQRNTYLTPRGKRDCRACRHAAVRRYRIRKRGAES